MNVVMGDGMDFMPTTERYVLLVLADAANDDGVTWIPIKGRADKRSIMKKTSLSERGVQNCLRALETDGHISRDERPGRGVVYTVHPRTRCTPAQDAPAASGSVENAAPPHEVHPRTKCTGAPDAPTPARGAPKPFNNPSTPLEPNGSNPPQGGGDDEVSSKKAGRGERIPSDWTAPAIADLPPRAQAKARQWPAGAYEAEAEAFLNFWLAEGRAGSRKLDWNRTWCNRINEITGRVLRDAKAGVRHTAPATTGPTQPAKAHDTSRENGAAAKIRTLAKAKLGEQVYGQWVGPCRMDIDAGVLTVVAVSSFASNYLRGNFANEIGQAMHAVLGPDADLRFSHEKPPV